jgi:hypothetical protein
MTARSRRLVVLLATTTTYKHSNTMNPYYNPHFSVSGVPDVDAPPRDATLTTTAHGAPRALIPTTTNARGAPTESLNEHI